MVVDELAELEDVINSIPLSSPLTVSRRFTSGFGVRRDPINGRHSAHHGIDFAAAWASPVTATASGNRQVRRHAQRLGPDGGNRPWQRIHYALCAFEQSNHKKGTKGEPA